MQTHFNAVLMLVILTAADVVADDVVCANGTATGERIVFAKRPARCSSDNIATNHNCDSGSTGGRDGISVNGGSKVYITSGLLIAKGTTVYMGLGGMKVNTNPSSSTWSVNHHITLPPSFIH